MLHDIDVDIKGLHLKSVYKSFLSDLLGNRFSFLTGFLENILNGYLSVEIREFGVVFYEGRYGRLFTLCIEVKFVSDDILN